MDAEKLIVIKQNTDREETWRYEGRVLDRNADSILVEAFFNRSDLPFHGVLLKETDRFLEVYFNNRWYNIFEIHDRDDDQLKAWYCNVTLPAAFENGHITYVDLALDLFVYPDGKQLVLDEDEFEELKLTEKQKAGALSALEELKSIFRPPVHFRLGQDTQELYGRKIVK